METFTEPREFAENARYWQDREEMLAALDLGSIDEPIRDIVAGFARLPHCFTLQCCFGHFICAPEQDPRSLDPIPSGHSGRVRYRIAYVGFCLENSRRGRSLRRSLERIAAVDPDYIQFGSADGFWEDWVNSYALQVEPVLHKMKDEAILECAEALQCQRVRDAFFKEMRVLLAEELRQGAVE